MDGLIDLASLNRSTLQSNSHKQFSPIGLTDQTLNDNQMKKLSILTMVAFAAAAFNLASCDEEHTHGGPSITINGPTGMLESGDTAHLSVTFTDDHELHEYLVQVVRELDDSTVQTFSGHSHEQTFTLEESFVVTTTDHSDFIINASVSNHDGESGTATATFHVHPH